MLEEERKKRLAERKVQRKDERRANWLKEREEEEERKREEEQKLLEEEVRKKQEEEEQKKKILKEIEAEQYRCVTVVWVLSLPHCMFLLCTNLDTWCYLLDMCATFDCLGAHSCQEIRNTKYMAGWFVCQTAVAYQPYFSQLDRACVLLSPPLSSSFSWLGVGPLVDPFGLACLEVSLMLSLGFLCLLVSFFGILSDV